VPKHVIIDSKVPAENRAVLTGIKEILVKLIYTAGCNNTRANHFIIFMDFEEIKRPINI
jgi:hypothetical protein